MSFDTNSAIQTSFLFLGPAATDPSPLIKRYPVQKDLAKTNPRPYETAKVLALVWDKTGKKVI